ncbi:hypothetical protein BDC45DRAFT_82727 [Circinella umbellata]|nr:hypothetical protein BDC45DRAFT_82727 [Circinella umbellata]
MLSGPNLSPSLSKMSFYLDRLSPSEWNLDDALKSYRSRFFEDDPEKKLKADLLKIKEKSLVKMKSDQASKLLEQLGGLNNRKNMTLLHIGSFTYTNNGQQQSSLLGSAHDNSASSALPVDSSRHTISPIASDYNQPSHGPVDSGSSYRVSQHRNPTRARQNDPVDDFFNPLPETASSSTHPVRLQVAIYIHVLHTCHIAN